MNVAALRNKLLEFDQDAIVWTDNDGVPTETQEDDVEIYEDDPKKVVIW